MNFKIMFIVHVVSFSCSFIFTHFLGMMNVTTFVFLQRTYIKSKYNNIGRRKYY